MDWYFTHGENAERTCRHFSLSKSVFYRWLNRFNKYNLTTLEFDSRKRRPKHTRTMTTHPDILRKIYEIRKADLEKSKYEIHEELSRQGIRVAHNVIQKVINRNPELHNVQAVKLATRRRQQIARIKAARELREAGLGSLVQVDTKHLYILGRKIYLFAAIDCKSRYAFIRAYGTASSTSAADFLNRLKQAFPFKIQALNTDNGSEYLLFFHQASQALGLTHYFSYPHTPQMNGRVERFIKTAMYEYFNWQDDLIPDVDSINRKCAEFNYKYTQNRFHQALGYQTPAEYVNNYLSSEKEATVLYV